MSVDVRQPEPGITNAGWVTPALADLWREAISRPMHSPACGCAVPSSIRLDAGHVELDILDYVEDKHDLARYAGWMNARQSRAESRNAAFPAWLESLGALNLMPAVLWKAVVADVARVLDSMASHAANRLVPAGALEKGWLGGST